MFGGQVKQQENYGSYWQSVYHHLDASPKADDGLLTLCTSLVRQSLMSNHFEGIFTEDDKEGLLSSLQLLEVTYLMDEDRFKGFLVRFRVENKTGGSSFEFEFMTKCTQQVQTNKMSTFAQRMSVLEVSTDFDQKEQRARNYAKAMGPFAEPVVVFQLRKKAGGGEEGDKKDSHSMPNVTALWIDPVGNIAEVSEIVIDDQPNLIFFAKSNPIHPLQPGVWTVKLLQKGTAVAQVKFLVVPLEFLNQREISQAKAKIVNRGAESELNFGNSVEWDRHLLPREERIELMRKARGFADRFGEELGQWVDRLVRNFYLIHEYCVVVVSHGNSIVDRSRWEKEGGRFEECSKTRWSSLAPDPKSEIRGGGGGAGGDSLKTGNNVDL